MNDAHLHLQDPRLKDTSTIIQQMKAAGITRCVVNGTSPEDWARVEELNKSYPELVIPSYGLHPWKTPQPDDTWKDQLKQKIQSNQYHAIGECGLDRWIKNPDRDAQEDAFLFQLELACMHNGPLSIHILKAWGWFMDLLRAHPFPERGFLLHSYNGSEELLPELIERGAYFSFSGYYLHEKKTKQQAVFKSIPRDRLLVETDAPDMLPPAHIVTHPLQPESPVNHPANLPSIAKHLADLLECDRDTLINQLDRNFSDFFLKQ